MRSRRIWSCGVAQVDEFNISWAIFKGRLCSRIVNGHRRRFVQPSHARMAWKTGQVILSCLRRIRTKRRCTIDAVEARGGRASIFETPFWYEISPDYADYHNKKSNHCKDDRECLPCVDVTSGNTSASGRRHEWKAMSLELRNCRCRDSDWSKRLPQCRCGTKNGEDAAGGLTCKS